MSALDWDAMRLVASSRKRPLVEGLLADAITLRDQLRSIRAGVLIQREDWRTLGAQLDDRLAALEPRVLDVEEKVDRLEQILRETGGQVEA